jgi:hypothetical protein
MEDDRGTPKMGKKDTPNPPDEKSGLASPEGKCNLSFARLLVKNTSNGERKDRGFSGIFVFVKYIFYFLILFVSFSCYGQRYVLPNESIIFSFETANGKHVALVQDTADKYIVYRFGSKEKIEFEYPEKTADSWKQFKYSYWLRGGGPINEGIDLNYVCFENKGYRYIIYDTYAAVGNVKDIGVRVMDLATKKETYIPGKLKTRKGTMIDLRFKDLIAKSDELFD